MRTTGKDRIYNGNISFIQQKAPNRHIAGQASQDAGVSCPPDCSVEVGKDGDVTETSEVRLLSIEMPELLW